MEIQYINDQITTRTTYNHRKIQSQEAQRQIRHSWRGWGEEAALQDTHSGVGVGGGMASGVGVGVRPQGLGWVGGTALQDTHSGVGVGRGYGGPTGE